MRGGALLQKNDNRIYTMHGKDRFLFVNGRVDGEPAIIWHKDGQEPSYILMGELTEEMQHKPYVEIITSVPK